MDKSNGTCFNISDDPPVSEKVPVSSTEPPTKILCEDGDLKNDKDKQRKDRREDDVMVMYTFNVCGVVQITQYWYSIYLGEETDTCQHNY